MNIVDRAEQIALIAHFGMKNKHDDEPYVLHLQRVYIAVRDAGNDEVRQAIAWLHDTVEDTELTFRDILDDFDGNEISARIASGVLSLTKRAGEPNERYYQRVKNNPDAIAVKIHDIHDNFGRNHLIEDQETKLRMAKKYSLGLDILTRTH